MTSIYTLENKLSEHIKKMKEIAKEEFNIHNKFYSQEECFNIISDKLITLNLTNGYKLENIEIQALLLIDKLSDKIDKLNNTSTNTDNILLSLIDLASYNVELFAEDAFTEEYIDYFNEKQIFNEYYKVSSSDFIILYSFYRLLNMILEEGDI